MEIKFFPNGTLEGELKRGVESLYVYLSNPDSEIHDDMYDWDAPEHGMYLLLDGDRVAGHVTVHQSKTTFDGQEFALGGFGGLVVHPDYRGFGYGRQLAEAALEKAREIGIDVACMTVNMESGITAFYERLGYRFLGRPAFFINWANQEKSDDTMMLMGIHDPALAEKILISDLPFHYGPNRGHW